MLSAAKFLGRQALRLEARWSHWSLDERLAAGFEPESDPALAVRAVQLCSPRHRRRLAASAERLARDSDVASSRRAMSSAVPIAREQVSEARESLLRLAAVLRDAEEVRPRGVAIVKRLFTDSDSYVYTRCARGVVELQVQLALDYLVADDISARSSASATPLGRPRLTHTA